MADLAERWHVVYVAQIGPRILLADVVDGQVECGVRERVNRDTAVFYNHQVVQREQRVPVFVEPCQLWTSGKRHWDALASDGQSRLSFN